MPVLKVYQDGAWKELGGTTQLNGGNADTLDGYHASDFTSIINAAQATANNANAKFPVSVQNGGTGATDRVSAINSLNDTTGSPEHINTCYQFLSQTGLASGSTDTKSVFANMKPNSSVTFTLSEHYGMLADLPVNYGIVTLTKGVDMDYLFGSASSIMTGERYVLNKKYGTDPIWQRVTTNILSQELGDYGTTLPTPGTPGRIFFLKASE